jgi:predicted ester cyclase
MSPEEHKARSLRFIEEVLNNRNLSIMEEFIAPEYTLHDSQPPVEGPDGYRHFVESILATFPDIHFTLEDFMTVGDKNTLRWAMTATHQGVWLGIPPTGKAVTDSGLILSRTNAEGKVVEQWITNDGLGLLHQIGGIPSFSAAPA